MKTFRTPQGATTERSEPAQRSFRTRVSTRLVSVTAATSLAVAGLLGAGVATANAADEPTFPAITNSVLAIDCSDPELQGNHFDVPIAIGTAVSITATNCTYDFADTGVTTISQYSAYSVASDSNEYLDLDLGDDTDGHEISLYIYRVDAVADPSGVLSVTAPSTIPSTGFTSFDAAIEDGNLTEHEGDDSLGYLGGDESCEIEVGQHPYATKTVTIALDGSYTFRVVATSPQSSDLVILPGTESPITDPFLAVYSAFDPAHPGTGIIGCNDDGGEEGSVPNVGIMDDRFPSFTSTLAPGTYTLVLSSWGQFTDDAFSEFGLDQSALYQMWGPEGGIVADVVPPTPTAALDLALGFANGASINNATGTATASGLKEGTTWSLVLHSDPITLGTGVVDGTGVVSAPFTIPANLAPGLHRIILTGVAPDNTVLTSTVWFTLNADGTVSGISRTEPELPPTGAGDALGGVSLALLALLIGSSVMLIARRRARTL
jgi:hypothetical protein